MRSGCSPCGTSSVSRTTGTIDVGIKGLGDIFVDKLTQADVEAWRDSLRPGDDDELAGPHERAPVVLEIAESVPHLGPGGFAGGWIERREHLVERAEGLALEREALVGRLHPEGGKGELALHVSEPRSAERVLGDARSAEAEGAGLPGERGTELGRRAHHDDELPVLGGHVDRRHRGPLEGPLEELAAQLR
jgi:hypothetical protein